MDSLWWQFQLLLEPTGLGKSEPLQEAPSFLPCFHTVRNSRHFNFSQAALHWNLLHQCYKLMEVINWNERLPIPTFNILWSSILKMPDPLILTQKKILSFRIWEHVKGNRIWNKLQKGVGREKITWNIQRAVPLTGYPHPRSWFPGMASPTIWNPSIPGPSKLKLRHVTLELKISNRRSGSENFHHLERH